MGDILGGAFFWGGVICFGVLWFFNQTKLEKLEKQGKDVYYIQILKYVGISVAVGVIVAILLLVFGSVTAFITGNPDLIKNLIEDKKPVLAISLAVGIYFLIAGLISISLRFYKVRKKAFSDLSNERELVRKGGIHFNYAPYIAFILFVIVGVAMPSSYEYYHSNAIGLDVILSVFTVIFSIYAHVRLNAYNSRLELEQDQYREKELQGFQQQEERENHAISLIDQRKGQILELQSKNASLGREINELEGRVANLNVFTDSFHSEQQELSLYIQKLRSILSHSREV